MSKSRPRYAPLAFDDTGRRHLLVADDAEIPAEVFAQGTSCKSFEERWVIVRHSRALPSRRGNGPSLHEFRSLDHLLIALRRRLNEERMGFRLYAVGSEGFLWEVRATTAAVGMSGQEVQLFQCGSRARRVFCNHCRTITEGVTTNIAVCSGCGAHLFVRDHFSRRLRAFAGFQVDAEVPGEIPEIEELRS